MALPTRREVLQRAIGGFGAIALHGMLAEEIRADEIKSSTDPLAPKKPHHEARAKRVIFLYMTGGVSHVDSFDPKPELFAGHGKKITVDFLRFGRIALLYQTLDGMEAGVWDQANRTWEPLDTSYRSAIREGLRIARKQAAPDLIRLPLPAASDAEEAG